MHGGRILRHDLGKETLLTTTIFIIAAVVGAVTVLSAFLLTDFDFGADSDLLPHISMSSIAAGVFGFGSTGLIASGLGVPSPLTWALAGVAGFGILWAFNGLFLPYLHRQEANSHSGRTDYIGKTATVTLDIEPDGWGEVSLVDRDNNRVQTRAKVAQDGDRVLSKSERVIVADVDADYVYVVAVS